MRILSVAAALLVAMPALADEMPARKAGLWESKIVGEGAPPVTAQQCVDAETDKRAMEAMGGAVKCAKKTFTKTSDGYDTATDCDIAGMKVTGKGKVTGDFETTFRIEQETTMSGMPGMAGPTTRKMVIEAKRLGDCLPGQKPGDMIMPDGRVVKTPGSPQ